MAKQEHYVYNTLTALDETSDYVTVRGRHEILIKGSSFVGTVAIQWCFDSGNTWYDIASWSTDFVTSDEVGSNIKMRFKVTAYTSGSVVVCIRNNTAG